MADPKSARSQSGYQPGSNRLRREGDVNGSTFLRDHRPLELRPCETEEEGGGVHGRAAGMSFGERWEGESETNIEGDERLIAMGCGREQRVVRDGIAVGVRGHRERERGEASGIRLSGQGVGEGDGAVAPMGGSQKVVGSHLRQNIERLPGEMLRDVSVSGNVNQAGPLEWMVQHHIGIIAEPQMPQKQQQQQQEEEEAQPLPQQAVQPQQQHQVMGGTDHAAANPMAAGDTVPTALPTPAGPASQYPTAVGGQPAAVDTAMRQPSQPGTVPHLQPQQEQELQPSEGSGEGGRETGVEADEGLSRMGSGKVQGVTRDEVVGIAGDRVQGDRERSQTGKTRVNGQGVGERRGAVAPMGGRMGMEGCLLSEGGEGVGIAFPHLVRLISQMQARNFVEHRGHHQGAASGNHCGTGGGEEDGTQLTTANVEGDDRLKAMGCAREQGVASDRISIVDEMRSHREGEKGEASRTRVSGQGVGERRGAVAPMEGSKGVEGSQLAGGEGGGGLMSEVDLWDVLPVPCCSRPVAPVGEGVILVGGEGERGAERRNGDAFGEPCELRGYGVNRFASEAGQIGGLLGCVGNTRQQFRFMDSWGAVGGISRSWGGGQAEEDGQGLQVPLRQGNGKEDEVQGSRLQAEVRRPGLNQHACDGHFPAAVDGVRGDDGSGMVTPPLRGQAGLGKDRSAMVLDSQLRHDAWMRQKGERQKQIDQQLEAFKQRRGGAHSGSQQASCPLRPLTITARGPQGHLLSASRFGLGQLEGKRRGGEGEEGTGVIPGSMKNASEAGQEGGRVGAEGGAAGVKRGETEGMARVNQGFSGRKRKNSSEVLTAVKTLKLFTNLPPAVQDENKLSFGLGGSRGTGNAAKGEGKRRSARVEEQGGDAIGAARSLSGAPCGPGATAAACGGLMVREEGSYTTDFHGCSRLKPLSSKRRRYQHGIKLSGAVNFRRKDGGVEVTGKWNGVEDEEDEEEEEEEEEEDEEEDAVRREERSKRQKREEEKEEGMVGVEEHGMQFCQSGMVRLAQAGEIGGNLGVSPACLDIPHNENVTRCETGASMPGRGTSRTPGFHGQENNGPLNQEIAVGDGLQHEWVAIQRELPARRAFCMSLWNYANLIEPFLNSVLEEINDLL